MLIREILNRLNTPATNDTLIAGEPDQPVGRIAVTFTASVAVLQKAATSGANLIITHEPTYYSDSDHQVLLAKDPVYLAKRNLIEAHRLTIWRCHDWWHQFRSDGILMGMARQLGWDKHEVPGQPEVFDLPERPLDVLVEQLKATLRVPSLRVMGNPAASVRRVALSCGCPYWHDHRRLLNTVGVDVLVCGELREWETCEYVRDSQLLGQMKNLIVLGHLNSEEGGMRYFAEWLQQQFPSIPVDFTPAGDPFRYV